MHKLTAAHRTLPLGSVAVVRSLSTGRQVTVRINDRGPFARGRILDLSLAGAQAVGMVGRGTDEIELRVISYAGRAGEWECCACRSVPLPIRRTRELWSNG
jgi:rare lipoprotein A